jgi:hypothetical protein
LLFDGLAIGLWIQAGGVGEGVGRLAGSFLIKDTLYCIDDVGAVFGCLLVGLSLTICDHGRYFSEFRLCGHFRSLDAVDLFVAFLGQLAQLGLEAFGIVVRGVIRVLLGAILDGYSAGVVFALVKLVAHIIGGSAFLLGEWTGAGSAQVVRKVVVAGFDAAAVIRTGVHGHHRGIIGPLMPYKQWRPFAVRQTAHLHNRSIVPVTSSPVRSAESSSDWLASVM